MYEEIDLKEFLKEFLSIEIDNIEIYQKAFTHSSYDSKKNYQRLEFLGDAVLNLVISDYLYHKHPNEKEGFLTKERASYVRKEVLGMISEELKFNQILKLGRGEESDGGREKTSILSDILESFIGALYLDKGFLYTRDWILKNLSLFDKYRYDIRDYKSILQERLQKKGNLPVYELVKEDGESHKKNYLIELFIEGELISKGEGRSKKLAEQESAKLALKKLFPDEEI